MKARQAAARQLVQEKIRLRKEGSAGGAKEPENPAFTYQSRTGLVTKPVDPKHRHSIFGRSARQVIMEENPTSVDEYIPSMRPSAQARHESLHRMQKRRNERAKEDAQERDKVLNSLLGGSEPTSFQDALAAMNAKLVAQNVTMCTDEDNGPLSNAKKTPYAINHSVQPQPPKEMYHADGHAQTLPCPGTLAQSFKPLQEACNTPQAQPVRPRSPKVPLQPPPPKPGHICRPQPDATSGIPDVADDICGAACTNYVEHPAVSQTAEGGSIGQCPSACIHTAQIEACSVAIKDLEKLKGAEPENHEDRKALAVIYTKRATVTLQIVREKVEPGEPLPSEMRPHAMRANLDAANATDLDEGNASAWLRKGQALLTMNALPHRAKEAVLALERARDCPNLSSVLKTEVDQWLKYAKSSFDAQTPMPEGCAQM